MVVAAIFAAFLGVTIVYATGQVRAGTLTVGGWVLVNTCMLQLVRPVEMLGYASQAFSQGVAMLEKMLELFHEQTEPQEHGDLIPAPLKGPGTHVFEHVNLTYGDGRSVLRDVSFVVPAGTKLGLVGASGAGKSSLVRLLVRMFEPDRGRILLDGVPITELSLAELRRAIAVVPQDTPLFGDSIRYNIAFGRAGCTQADIERAARLAHLHDFIMSLPKGYDTRVGERDVRLSGGERQRVSIARAAIKHPQIYVFDEATSSLDSKTERPRGGRLLTAGSGVCVVVRCQAQWLVTARQLAAPERSAGIHCPVHRESRESLIRILRIARGITWRMVSNDLHSVRHGEGVSHASEEDRRTVARHCWDSLGRSV